MTALFLSLLLLLTPHATLKVTPQVCLIPCHITVKVKVNPTEYDRAFLVGIDGEPQSTRPIVDYTVEIPYTIKEEGDHIVSLNVLDQSGRSTFSTWQRVLVN